MVYHRIRHTIYGTRKLGTLLLMCVHAFATRPFSLPAISISPVVVVVVRAAVHADRHPREA